MGRKYNQKLKFNFTLALVMMLVGTFAFADVIVVPKISIELENSITTDESEEVAPLINFSVDNGGVYKVLFNIYGENGEVVDQFYYTWESPSANSAADCKAEVVALFGVIGILLN